MALLNELLIKEVYIILDVLDFDNLLPIQTYYLKDLTQRIHQDLGVLGLLNPLLQL
jgi:hypothetical protein